MTPSIVLRGLQVGDIGWVAHSQGILYAQEYGWGATCRSDTTCWAVLGAGAAG